jgi:hypothetical protein
MYTEKNYGIFCNAIVAMSLLFGLSALHVFAQQTGSFETVISQDVQLQQQNTRKKIIIKRTQSAPVIDGKLDDDTWKTATVITDMHQFQPRDHVDPSEKSEFYLMYDDRFLYVGARLYDSNPGLISARQLIQGQGLGFDDAFEFILDTFNNRRTGYHFQTNPNGIRREGVYDSPDNLNRDWTGIWKVESRIDEKGWTSEIAIPFNTLNFDPNQDEWGFTIARTIARKQEELAWESFNRRINPTTTGLMKGISGIKQGVGLDVIPSIAAASSKSYVGGEDASRVDPSLNVFYKFTPNLTGALTVNTDFSATEVDNRQVNLSRFSLFFPEKRDFFLQDIDIFSFGGRSGGGGRYNQNINGIPFYSRRIGLSSTGQAVDINAGLKLTGRVGRWNVGGLAVQQGDTTTLDGQKVFVGRASANVLGNSSVGAIFTYGDPNSDRSNALAGVDFNYQNPRFTDRYSLNSDFFYQKTDTDGLNGDSKAFGASVSSSTNGNGYGGNIGYEYFGEDFYPAMGFANRVGVDRMSFTGRRRQFFRNNKVLRLMNSFMRYDYTRVLETKELQSESLFTRPIQIETNLGGSFGIGWGRNREGLQRDFEIRPGIVIPAGKYSYDNINVEMSFSNQRSLAPYFSYRKGDFYNGDQKEWGIGFEWRPDEHLYFGLSYNYQDVKLPEGDFEVKLASANINYAFNSKLSWVNLLQYDNYSSSVGLNSRLRWNPQAGEDLFVVLNLNMDATGVFTGLSRESAEIALKYTKTLRF